MTEMMDIMEAKYNAETAYNNQNYETALKYYQIVLNQSPNDLHSLSRSGAISVILKKYDDALKYFETAKNVDPENGDNFFNYGNAFFFKGDYVKALDAYLEAEKRPCSDDVLPRIYYQLGLLFSSRQETDNALVYLRKCEDADKTGMIALTKDFISEKLKIYMIRQEFINAEKCAAQLVAVDPTVYRNYAIYFSLLMGNHNYEAAERVLDGALKYAEIPAEQQTSVSLQRAALESALAKEEPEKSAQHHARAIQILEEKYADKALSKEQIVQLAAEIGELYYDAALYDQAINWLETSLKYPGRRVVEKQEQKEEEVITEEVLEDSDFDRMVAEDIQKIQESIDLGVIDENMGAYAEVDYDDDGNERHYYSEGDFDGLVQPKDFIVAPEEPEEPEQPYTMPVEFREKMNFTLMQSYLAKDDFAGALTYIMNLKHSENRYYKYYGIYTEALVSRKLNEEKDKTDRKYAQAIAFFRNKSFANSKDTLAAIFRARLYAEEGKYGKAQEIAELLSEADRESVLKYIEDCKS